MDYFKNLILQLQLLGKNDKIGVMTQLVGEGDNIKKKGFVGKIKVI